MSNGFDIRQISAAFQHKVEDAISNGKKGVADKKEDFEALQALLSGTEDVNEQGFVRSKMDEYTTKFKLSDLRDRANEFVREAIDGMKKLYSPKKELNIDEAKKLIPDLESAEKDGRTADAEYIRAELEAAGFGNLVKEYDDAKKAEKTKEAEKEVEKSSIAPNEGTKSDANKSTEGTLNGSETGPAPVKKKTTKPVKNKKVNNNPKYDARQQKLINDMSKMIDAILNARNFNATREALIEGAEKILRDAKALGLESTKEYISLSKLVGTRESKIKKLGRSMGL